MKESSIQKENIAPDRPTAKWQWWGFIALSLLCGALLILLEAIKLHDQITVGNLDFFSMIVRAKQLPAAPRAWVHGFYPVGIPLLLRLGLALGLNVIRTGQILSIIGGLLCLYGGGLLAWGVTRSKTMTLITMGILLTRGTILFYAGFEGTDMLAAGLQALAVGILAVDPTRRRMALIAGIVNGVGYLIRYTALITLVVCLAYLAIIVIDRRKRQMLWLLPIYGAGFLLGALPQLIPSLLAEGNPFYQTQAYHIWIKLYANSDYLRTLQESTPVDITLWELFWLDPLRFARNWWHEFSNFWLTLDTPLVGNRLEQIVRGAFLFTVLAGRQLSTERRTLMGVFALGITGILSIFTVNTRFLILLTPVFAVCVTYFLWWVFPSALRVGRIRVPVNLILLVALLGASLPGIWQWAHTPEGGPHAAVIRASNIFHAAGAEGAHEVLTTELYHQDVASPTRDQFALLHTFPVTPTLNNLRQGALDSGYRFIYYDAVRGLNYNPQYEELIQAGYRSPGYTPIWMSEPWVDGSDRFAAYRLEPEAPTPQTSLMTDLGSDVTLLGYDLTVSANQPAETGHSLGIYLYWQATVPLTSSFKVFVHLWDSEGNLVAQHDSVPAMWTYDTQEWEPGETVIDFHIVDLPPETSSGTFVVQAGMYNQETLERLPVLSASGVAIDDKVTLTEFSID